MDEKTVERNKMAEIDLNRLVSAVWYRIWIILLAAAVSAVAAFLVTYYLITPQYQSSAMFYVNNSSISVGDVSIEAGDINSVGDVSIEAGDINAAKSLVDSYIVILNTRETLNDVIDYAGVDRTYSELKNMISAASVNSTEIFEVVVTSPDPEEAERIANAISYILPDRIKTIIEGTSAKIVDTAVIPTGPSSPSCARNTLVFFMLGFLLAVACVVLREVFDITITTEEDTEQISKHPVLASVPDMGAPSKGGYYYYGYGGKRRGKYATASPNHGKAPVLIGGEISFAAAEAYKLLRTKLQFSFADDSNSRIIGLSSALSGEGKSLTAVNLAYTLSQLDKKVLLVDCDMRRPTLAEKLNIQKRPGLSGYLTGQHRLEEAIQQCGIKNEEDAFEVIAAGQNPPNPIELLSSAKMTRLLEKLRERYDYVILDLPPVEEVSDAMAVAKATDGILLVVRQNYCDRVVLKDAVRQFAFIDTKILGVVYNCTTEHGGRYGKGYYRKYHHKYGKKYGRYYRRYEDPSAKTGGDGKENK